MTDYRVYRRISPGGFDGSTQETAVYTQTGYAFGTQTSSVVGVWTATNLGRKGGVCSLIQVWSGGAANPGETVVISNSDPVAVRYSVPLSPEGTGWLFATSTDILTINAPLTTNILIAVTDLDEDQLAEIAAATFVSANNSGGGPGSGSSTPVFTSLTFISSATIPTFSGALTVFLEFALAGTITLPPLVDVPVGSEVIFIRKSGVGLPTIEVDNPGVDEVNGTNDVIYSTNQLRNLQDAIIYRRIPGGWQRSQGDSAQDGIPNIGPFSSVDGNNYFTFAANVILPPIQLCRKGVRWTFRNTDAAPHTMTPSPGESINGGPNINIPAGTVGSYEVASDTEWIAIVSA